MENIQRTFTSPSELFEFADARSKQIQLYGMIKEGPDSTTILYAPQSCDAWISIAAVLIEEITFIRNSPCLKPNEEPHQHPYVRLTLKASVAETHSHFAIIAKLLTAHQRLQRQVASLRSKTRGVREQFSKGLSDTPCKLGYGPCGGWNDEWKEYCPKNERPCHEEDGTYCLEFPECT